MFGRLGCWWPARSDVIIDRPPPSPSLQLNPQRWESLNLPPAVGFVVSHQSHCIRIVTSDLFEINLIEWALSFTLCSRNGHFLNLNRSAQLRAARIQPAEAARRSHLAPKNPHGESLTAQQTWSAISTDFGLKSIPRSAG